MYIGEFISAVRTMREHQNAWRKHHRRADIIAALEWAKMVDRGLEEGIVVVESLPVVIENDKGLDLSASQRPTEMKQNLSLEDGNEN